MLRTPRGCGSIPPLPPNLDGGGVVSLKDPREKMARVGLPVTACNAGLASRPAIQSIVLAWELLRRGVVYEKLTNMRTVLSTDECVWEAAASLVFGKCGIRPHIGGPPQREAPP